MNKKHKRFCQEYVIDLNGSKAAIRAGYRANRSKVTASELLLRKDVQKYIARLQQKMSEKLEISAERVLQELAKIGFSNIQDFINGNNSVQELKNIDSAKTAAVESIKTIITEQGNQVRTSVSFKFHDKVAALEKLGRHLGVFEKDNAQLKPQVTIIPEAIANASIEQLREFIKAADNPSGKD